MTLRPSSTTLFPYTTLFRSREDSSRPCNGRLRSAGARLRGVSFFRSSARRCARKRRNCLKSAAACKPSRRDLLARKQPHQLFHFAGRIDELAAPALRARAVGERQGPAVPHLEIDAEAAFPRALDLPATDERARRRDEVGAAD